MRYRALRLSVGPFEVEIGKKEPSMYAPTPQCPTQRSHWGFICSEPAYRAHVESTNPHDPDLRRWMKMVGAGR